MGVKSLCYITLKVIFSGSAEVLDVWNMAKNYWYHDHCKSQECTSDDKDYLNQHRDKGIDKELYVH